ncbi:LLM class flavin-dependent oxidoreductase [Streptomyces cyaneofuscatus]|uniref:LLM class flavin-dependent oxidoreductase n=1 Tax=Streptomyces cyaneofuscatus TaxID=66883 RepID=UPI00364CD23F
MLHRDPCRGHRPHTPRRPGPRAGLHRIDGRRGVRQQSRPARRAEQLGYSGYWFAEHHLNPGVAGTSPAVLLALAAAVTSAIRLSSGALPLGHRTSLSAVDEFGLLDAVHPGRFDLGLGRSGGPVERGTPVADGVAEAAATVGGRAPNGPLVPERYSNEHLLRSPRLALHRKLLHLPGAESQAYDEQVGDILALSAGTYAPDAGFETQVVPGEGAALQLRVLGSSAGISAQVAGANGSLFAANYHVSPGTVLEAAPTEATSSRSIGRVSRRLVPVASAVRPARAFTLRTTGASAWSVLR